MSFSCAISAASTGITDGDFDFAVGKPNTKITRRCRILRAARYELCLPVVNDRIPSVEYFLWVCPFQCFESARRTGASYRSAVPALCTADFLLHRQGALKAAARWVPNRTAAHSQLEYDSRILWPILVEQPSTSHRPSPA